MSVRWRRNQRLKCACSGYHFPHRRGGGACTHSKTGAYHAARRAGDFFQASVEFAALFLSGWKPWGFEPQHEECPF